MAIFASVILVGMLHAGASDVDELAQHGAGNPGAAGRQLYLAACTTTNSANQLFNVGTPTNPKSIWVADGKQQFCLDIRMYKTSVGSDVWAWACGTSNARDNEDWETMGKEGGRKKREKQKEGGH